MFNGKLGSFESAVKGEPKSYTRGMNWLRKNMPYMVPRVRALGIPTDTQALETFGVARGHDGRVLFMVNDKKMSKLKDGELGTALLHEYNHVIRGHLEESAKPDPEWTKLDALYATQEVTINDHIESMGLKMPKWVMRGERFNGFFGFMDTKEAYPFVEKFFDEQQQLGGSGKCDGKCEEQQNQDANGKSGAECDCESDNNSEDSSESGGVNGSENQDSDESQKGGGQSQEGDENSESSSKNSQGFGEGTCGQDKKPKQVNEDGSLRDMTAEEINNFVDSLIGDVAEQIEATRDQVPENEQLPDDIIDSLDSRISKAMRGQQYKRFSKSSSAAGQNLTEQIMSDNKIQIGWVKILQIVNPDIGRDQGGLNTRATYDWSRQRRSSMLMPQKVRLPVYGVSRQDGYGAKMRPTVLIALDHSGSIDSRMTEVMRAMAKSIPTDYIDPYCVTFSTYYCHFDFRSAVNEVAGGGTDFSAVEYAAREVQKKTGIYPYVICLTDGYANFESAAPKISDLHKKWIWVDVDTRSDSLAFSMVDYSYNWKSSSRYKIALPYADAD